MYFTCAIENWIKITVVMVISEVADYTLRCSVPRIWEKVIIIIIKWTLFSHLLGPSHSVSWFHSGIMREALHPWTLEEIETEREDNFSEIRWSLSCRNYWSSKVCPQSLCSYPLDWIIIKDILNRMRLRMLVMYHSATSIVWSCFILFPDSSKTCGRKNTNKKGKQVIIYWYTFKINLLIILWLAFI